VGCICYWLRCMRCHWSFVNRHQSWSCYRVVAVGLLVCDTRVACFTESLFLGLSLCVFVRHENIKEPQLPRLRTAFRPRCWTIAQCAVVLFSTRKTETPVSSMLPNFLWLIYCTVFCLTTQMQGVIFDVFSFFTVKFFFSSRRILIWKAVLKLEIYQTYLVNLHWRSYRSLAQAIRPGSLNVAVSNHTSRNATWRQLPSKAAPVH
jgi:hypothetical protein